MGERSSPPTRIAPTTGARMPAPAASRPTCTSGTPPTWAAPQPCSVAGSASAPSTPGSATASSTGRRMRRVLSASTLAGPSSAATTSTACSRTTSVARAGSRGHLPRRTTCTRRSRAPLLQAELLSRAGYAAYQWGDTALARAFAWLHSQAAFPAEGDDSWQPHLVNARYGTRYPAPLPSRPGKGFGFADWLYR